MLTQTAAIFLDAYRELNARKMFWIVLVISLLVVAAFAMVGIGPNGVTVLWFDLPDSITTALVPRAMFYKLMFSALGVNYWLNVIAIVLALVSTAGIIPDFIASGSIDLYLSKPITRLRLFFTKYLSGLLFVAIQVFVFSAACFVLIGVRAGSWDARTFLAVPITVMVFSYLYCVCALLGLLTRSTVAALLLTILFWLGLSGLHFAETMFLQATIRGDIETRAYENRFAYSDKQIALLNARAATGDAAATTELADVTRRRSQLEEKKHASDGPRRNYRTVHRILYGVKRFLPKTGETGILLQRWMNLNDRELAEHHLKERDKRRATRNATMGYFPSFEDRTDIRFDDQAVVLETADAIASRPASWAVGTSLAFEAVILSIAAWVFCRREF